MSKGFRMRARLGAVLVMGAGCAVIFTAVLFMNSKSEPPPEASKPQVEMMAVKEKKKEIKKRKVEQPKRKQKSVKSMTAPLPQVASALSSAELGIPGLDVGTLMGMGSDAVVGSKSVENLVMSEDAVDVVPKPIRRSVPEYPRRARSKDIEGTVTLRVLIGKQGTVEKVKVVNSTPEGYFEDAAVSAVRSWQFEPALYRGEQVRVWARQVVRFNLG